MLAPERGETQITNSAGGERAEIDRRAAAFAQADRIEAYVPTLSARIKALEKDATYPGDMLPEHVLRELAETRIHLAQELQAIKDLRAEGSLTRSQARQRYRNRGETPPI